MSTSCASFTALEFAKTLIKLAKAGSVAGKDVETRLRDCDDFASAPSDVVAKVVKAAVVVAVNSGFDKRCLRRLGIRVASIRPPTEGCVSKCACKDCEVRASCPAKIDVEAFWLWVVGPEAAVAFVRDGLLRLDYGGAGR